MGNNLSSDQQQQPYDDLWWNKETSTTDLNKEFLESTKNNNEEEEYEELRRRRREAKIQEFRTDFLQKQQARKEALAEKGKEMLHLRNELTKYKQENEQLKQMLTTKKQPSVETNTSEELEVLQIENTKLQTQIKELNDNLLKSEDLTKQNKELRKSIASTQKDLQNVNSQVLEFEKERTDYRNHVSALKDVIQVSKKLLQIRENQLQELRTKVTEIETSLAEREMKLLSTDLKTEYERQLQNIRALRTLYEQRQAAIKSEKEVLVTQLTNAKTSLETETKKSNDLEERVQDLEGNVSNKYDQIKQLESQLGLVQAEHRGLEAEMSVINQLFSQILFGFNNGPEIDFDKLIKLLEENHDLLTDIVVNEESEEVSSALPKVLLDLVQQVNSDKNNSEAESEPEQEAELQQTINKSTHLTSAEVIQNKLPKVWRVLIELLRQQCGDQQTVIINDEELDPCYKSIETPKGPKLVLSVSKTFIRLKDLILEKKSLQKETTRLKQLNTHLEVRLQDQEKRLETVSVELSQTWHVVDRMQRQYQQLHSHEKILCYELAQKRKMLTELKQELEFCREKWQQARVKNSNTEEQWKKLRTEFAERKINAITSDELNNSAESGYSDDRDETSSSSDEENDLNTETETQTNVQNSTDDRLARREARLRRLEEQSEQLVRRVTNTTNRSAQISNRLEALHEQYGNGSGSGTGNENRNSSHLNQDDN